MAQLSLVAFALTVTGAAAGSGCPMAVNTGAVGSCMFSKCAVSRGPTSCNFGTCYCQPGFCRYPASTLHVESRRCVQRVPDSTCHLTRVCYKAGVTTSFCEKGLCMCKFGYHLNEQGVCEVNGPGFTPAPAPTNDDYDYDDGSWMPLDLSATNGHGHGNLTAAERQELAEIQRHENMAVSLNVLLFSLYVMISAMTVIGGVVALRRKLVSRTEASEYRLLAA